MVHERGYLGTRVCDNVAVKLLKAETTHSLYKAMLCGNSLLTPSHFRISISLK